MTHGLSGASPFPKPELVAQARKRSADFASVLALVAALLVPAIVNGYPLIFPDSAAYLRIGYGSYFGVERASGYGLFLKPFLATGYGPWAALCGQVLAIAAIVWAATRSLLRRAHAGIAIAVALVLSAWPWHSAQLMPDAFTAPLILLAWLVVSQRLGTAATVGVGVATLLLLTMHYTHLVLFAVATLAAVVFGRAPKEGWRDMAARGGFPLALLVIAALVQLGANAHYLRRASVTPGGPIFLFARLNEDGLITPWLDRHCGETRVAHLCALAPQLPRDSQQLLWNRDTPLARSIWQEGPASFDRWTLVDEMAIANRGAILESPLRFTASSLRGAASQLVHFRALDDECPEHCRDPHREIWLTLSDLDPAGFPAYRSSAQATTGLPVAAVRAITRPVTALALLALLPILFLARRRRDQELAALVGAVIAALLVNAALAGALSDVHDRYQSRLAWLAVLVAAIAVYRLLVRTQKPTASAA